MGHDIVGVDTDQRKLAALRNGESYIEDAASSTHGDVSSKLHPTHDLASCETVVVAVPTPLTRNREPDLGPLVAAGYRPRQCPP
jgi:UDP-N-acetyl-D-glucosamine dehydrogenase